MSEPKKVQLISREALFQGYFRVDRLHVRAERFDGSLSEPFTREVFDAGRYAVGVLLFDPQHDKVILVEQFRPGIMVKDDDPWVIELVAGIGESGESREETARRECFEEAGCTVAELHKIIAYYVGPGCTSQHFTIYVGRTTAPEDGIVRGVPEEGEDIRVHVMEAAQAISLLYAGKLRDAATIIAMQWFALHHTELRSRWLVSDASTPII
jgi:ADP-ribose pyrophosphatase